MELSLAFDEITEHVIREIQFLIGIAISAVSGTPELAWRVSGVFRRFDECNSEWSRNFTSPPITEEHSSPGKWIIVNAGPIIHSYYEKHMKERLFSNLVLLIKFE